MVEMIKVMIDERVNLGDRYNSLGYNLFLNRYLIRVNKKYNKRGKKIEVDVRPGYERRQQAIENMNNMFHEETWTK